MAHVDWSIEGPDCVNRNCAWVAPARFTAPPTGALKRDLKDSHGHFARIHLTQDGIPRQP